MQMRLYLRAEETSPQQLTSPKMHSESKENWVPTGLTWVHLRVQFSGRCSCA
jgi:hypothetical protein